MFYGIKRLGDRKRSLQGHFLARAWIAGDCNYQHGADADDDDDDDDGNDDDDDDDDDDSDGDDDDDDDKALILLTLVAIVVAVSLAGVIRKQNYQRKKDRLSSKQQRR